MKHVRLADILTEGRCRQVSKIINSTASSLWCTAKLRNYFATIRETLESKGVLPEYLAYAVEFSLTTAEASSSGKSKPLAQEKKP